MKHKLRCLLFIIPWFYVTIEARLSGFYYDNGLDQTVIQRLLTKQEKREVELEILNLLGLPARPRPMVPVHLAGSAPKFLLDIYKSMKENSGSRSTRSSFGLSGRDQQAIEESDVIMSFVAQTSHGGGLRHEHGRRLWFDVTEVPVEDSIVDAELRVYKSYNSSHHSSHQSFTVTVYQVVTDKRGQRELLFIDSVNTTKEYEDWLVFNMTGPLSSWVAIPDTNLGLYVSITLGSSSGHEVKPEDVGIVTTKGDEEHQPFMVGFFKSSSARTERVRQRRETRRRKKKSEYNPGDYSRNPLHPNHQSWSSRSCQMHNLFVSFRDLEWQDWIIAPEGYQAFYCSGECNFPLNAHMNATNHAIVQTLVHLMNPSQVPKPCCAPSKLSAISVLYFLEDSNVTLKKYKNMVVKSCGCH